MAALRVIVADDDAGVRGVLHEVLDDDDRFTVVALASSGGQLLALAEALRPDVVLMDVRMPGGGAAAARALLSLPPPVPPAGTTARHAPPVVVAVSAHTGASVVVSMLRAGVSGYLAKGRLAALPDLLARCAAGEVVLAVPSGAEALRQVLASGPEETTAGGAVRPSGPRRAP
jgi:DNA-binding NarL/FixJ family response regulator